MSLEIGEYPHKEVYYFLPLVRKVYALMLQHAIPDEYIPSLISNLKELTQYYAHAFLTEDIQFTQEDELMKALTNNLNLAFHGDLHSYLALIHEGQKYKTDGDIDRFMYGSLNAEAFARTHIVDGRPNYNTGSTGGLLHIQPPHAHEVLTDFAAFVAQERHATPIELWGNVAHGIVDAASIYEYLQRNHIPSSLHLCRYSPHAFRDSETYTIGESANKNAWHIAVDSLVSDEGTTVNQLLAFLKGTKRSSVWTSWNGINYCNKHQTTVVPSFVASPENGCGVFIEKQ